MRQALVAALTCSASALAPGAHVLHRPCACLVSGRPAIGCAGRAAAPLACAPPAEERPNVPPPPEEPIDPKQAIEELGTLFEQVKLVWTEGKTWTPEVRVEKRREIVGTYVRVFAPAVAFSGVQLSISLGWFFVTLALLSLSGRGFDDILNLSEGFTPLYDALHDNVDPSWGNAAIALVLLEVSAPLLIPLAALLTPGATGKLQAWLTSKGLDAEGINAKIEAVLEKTS